MGASNRSSNGGQQLEQAMGASNREQAIGASNGSGNRGQQLDQAIGAAIRLSNRSSNRSKQ